VKNRHKIFFTICFALSSQILNAQTKLNIEDAVNFALENNISIERSEITLNALERTKNHSWNSVSPSLSLGANSSVPIDALSDSESDYTASFGVSASLSLNLTANLYTSMKTAKLNYEIGKINFDDAKKSVELSVRQTFFGLLYEKENITLKEKNLQIAREQYNKNLQKYNAGRLSEIDVLSAEVDYKSAIPNVESAKTTYQNDLDNFKNLLGLSLDEEIELDGNLDSMIYLDEIKIDDLYIQSSSITLLEKKIESAKTSVLDKRFSAYAPSVNASVSMRDSSWYIGKESDPKKTTSLSLSATIPLDGYLPWSSKNDAIETAKESVKDYELQLKNERNKLQLSIDSYLRSIKQCQASIKSKQANVKLAQRSYNMNYEAYNRGTKELLSLQNANSSLLSAQVSLKSEIYTLVKTIMNLENEIGAEFGSLTAKSE